MIVREHISLSELTTFAVGGKARLVVTCETLDDVKAAVTYIRDRGLPFVVLGEGSNVLPPDEGYEGAVLLMRITGMDIVEAEEEARVTVSAGESWDTFVRSVAERNLWGVENLAGIPGTVGAAPVQNIGAYGMEVRQTVVSVEAYDVITGELQTIQNKDAGFAYRDSRFKHEPNLIITGVTFALQTSASPQLGYADLRTAQAEGQPLQTPLQIGEAVRTIRSKKFPDLREYGTAGSFFKNPIVSPEQFTALAKKYGAIPSFPNEHGIKIPLAFILDHVLNLRGFELGNAFLFGNQPLVLVATRNAHASDVEKLACEIETRVRKETGITIEREVRTLTAHEVKIFL